MEALRWVEQNMVAVFPLGDFKSLHRRWVICAFRRRQTCKEIIIAGFGGQGVLFAGQVLAYAAMDLGKEVTWIPPTARKCAAARPTARW